MKKKVVQDASSKEEEKIFDEEKKEALSILESHRGHFILSQALFLAIEQMNVRPIEGQGDGSLEREPSNLRHMKLLYKYVFNMFFPTLPMPMSNMTMDDLKESSITSMKYLEDVMDGNFIRKDIEDVFKEAIDTGVLSENKEAQNYHGNYMYMISDKNHVSHFKNRHTKRYLLNKKGKGNPDEKLPNNIVNLDSRRNQK